MITTTLKIRKSGLEAWLKWQSACLGSTKPTYLFTYFFVKKEKKNQLIWHLSNSSEKINCCWLSSKNNGFQYRTATHRSPGIIFSSPGQYCVTSWCWTFSWRCLRSSSVLCRRPNSALNSAIIWCFFLKTVLLLRSLLTYLLNCKKTQYVM